MPTADTIKINRVYDLIDAKSDYDLPSRITVRAITPSGIIADHKPKPGKKDITRIHLDRSLIEKKYKLAFAAGQ